MVAEVAMFDMEMRRRLGIAPVPVVIQALENQLMLALAEKEAKKAPKIQLLGR